MAVSAVSRRCCAVARAVYLRCHDANNVSSSKYSSSKYSTQAPLKGENEGRSATSAPVLDEARRKEARKDRSLLLDLVRPLGFHEKDLDAWRDFDPKLFHESTGKEGAEYGGTILNRWEWEKLFKRYGNSLWRLLSTTFPERQWHAFEFKHGGRVPVGYWENVANQRAFLDYVSPQLGIKGDLDAWYKIEYRELLAVGGRGLLERYNDSLSALLVAAYPEKQWDLVRFGKMPRNYWASLENQRSFMSNLGKDLGIDITSNGNEYEKWYLVSSQVLMDRGGNGLLSFYNKNFPALLAAVYPEHSWELWRFPRRIGKVNESKEEIDTLFERVEQALNIKKPEDWYRVTKEQLKSLRVSHLFSSRKGGVAKILSLRYPNISWEEKAFFSGGYRQASQKWLAATLNTLFPNERVHFNYRHPDVKLDDGGKESHLDIYLPDLNLAFEYQGAQHYEQLDVYGDVKQRMSRDSDKADRCAALGISLVAIPHWWDKQRPQLLAALLALRPDLFQVHLKAFLDEAKQGGTLTK